MIDTEALSCQELVELITDYLEGALDERDLRAFEAHLARLRRLHRVPRADANDDSPCRRIDAADVSRREARVTHTTIDAAETAFGCQRISADVGTEVP